MTSNQAMHARAAAWAAAALLAAATTLQAQEAAATTEARTMGATERRIAAGFERFLGDDAAAVVRALRQGEDLRLSDATDAAGPDDARAVVIENPTDGLGRGSVRISLKLAEYQLARAGIREPTASQLRAALTGGEVTRTDGTTTRLEGVLALRSAGMDWARIAREYGTRLGPVMTGRAELAPSTKPATARESRVERAAETAISSWEDRRHGSSAGRGR